MASAVLVSKIPEPYSRNSRHHEGPGKAEDMSANISVIGVQEGMGGLKESISKFRKHHGEVGDALMNISGLGTVTGDPVDKDEPRPAYHHAEWPMMIYHADGRERVVQDHREYEEWRGKGFRDDPYPKPQVAVLDPATEKKALMETNRQLQGQVTTQQDLIDRLSARLDAVEANGKRK